MHRAGLRKNAVAHYRTGRPRLPRPEKNRKILKKSVDKSGLLYYTEQVDSGEPKSLEQIWGYSSAGSPVEAVNNPRTYNSIFTLSSIWGYSSAGSPVEAVNNPRTYNSIFTLSSIWGYSSAGRALEWHSRGQRFDPAYLHHHRECEENLTSLEVGFLLYAAIAEMSSPVLNCSKSILKSICSR